MPEQCKHCGAEIGTQETAFIQGDNVVCESCYHKTERAGAKAIGAALHKPISLGFTFSDLCRWAGRAMQWSWANWWRRTATIAGAMLLLLAIIFLFCPGSVQFTITRYNLVDQITEAHYNATVILIPRGLQAKYGYDAWDRAKTDMEGIELKAEIGAQYDGVVTKGAAGTPGLDERTRAAFAWLGKVKALENDGAYVATTDTDGKAIIPGVRPGSYGVIVFSAFVNQTGMGWDLPSGRVILVPPAFFTSVFVLPFCTATISHDFGSEEPGTVH